jgi:hypothetical protein
MPQNCFLATLLTWRPRRWLAAAAVALGTFLILGLPTAVIPNPVFGREIPPTDWALEVLAVTSVLSGLLFATYIRNDTVSTITDERPARGGAIGAFLAYLAIGCPVCNKVALIALGSTGAIQFFAPIQPYLGALGIVALSWALIVRLRGELVCRLPTPPAPRTTDDRDSIAS